MNYPYSKILSVELLPVKYLELNTVVGWNLFAEWLTDKSCALLSPKYASANFTLNLIF